MVLGRWTWIPRCLGWIPRILDGVGWWKKTREITWTKNWTTKTQMKDDYQDDERFFKKVQFLPTKENERVGWLKKSMFFFGLTKIPLFCRVKRDFWGGSAFLWRFGRRCQADPRLGHHRCGSFGVMCQKVWIFHGNCLILSISSYWPPFGTVWVACVSRFHWAKKNILVTISTFRFLFANCRTKNSLQFRGCFNCFFFKHVETLVELFCYSPEI